MNCYSSPIYLWKDLKTNIYYVSRDFKKIIKPPADQCYMLLYDKEPAKYSPYRSFLTNSKQVSNEDFKFGFVDYQESRWRLNN